MTWYDSVGKLYEIIDIIANDLIALADWEEGDATWDTTVRTSENAKRVVHHIADDIYLALIAGNLSRRAGTQAMYGKGLLLVISDAWNAGTHEPDGNKQIVFVPFEAHTATVTADMETLDITYEMFTGAAGFAIVGIPAIHTDNRQSNFMVIVERNTNKLYADGYSNFYVYTTGNYISALFNTYTCGAAKFGLDVKYWKYTRHFNVQSQTNVLTLYGLYISLADSKAYYMKPLLYNETDYYRYPWAQAEFFVPVNTAKLNVADGDEIALPAPETKKYQVCLKQSPDSATYIYFCIIKAE